MSTFFMITFHTNSMSKFFAYLTLVCMQLSLTVSVHYSHHKEASQLICNTNQLPGFLMMGILNTK